MMIFGENLASIEQIIEVYNQNNVNNMYNMKTTLEFGKYVDYVMIYANFHCLSSLSFRRVVFQVQWVRFRNFFPN